MTIATLGHVELKCSDLEASRDHFYQVLGFEEEFRENDKIYMRAWGDWSAYSLILAESDTTEVGHIAFQTETDDDLEDYATVISESGFEVEWLEEGTEPKHGRSIRFSGPTDFEFELFHAIERVEVADEEKSKLRNQPQIPPDRGANIRRIDHINLQLPNVEKTTEWFQEILDFKLREQVVDEDGSPITTWLSVSPLVHEIAFGESPKEMLNHVAYYHQDGSPNELIRSADILRYNDVKITGGPGKHGVSQAHYLYHLDPSGHQIELFAGGYLIFDPNWEPITWPITEVSNVGTWWGKEIPYPRSDDSEDMESSAPSN